MAIETALTGSRQIGPAGATRQRSSFAKLARLASIATVALAIPLALTAACARRVPAAASADAAVGGPFTLINQDGKTVDQSLLNGKWSVVFFGYTYCPDYCPTTLTTLGRAMDALGAKAKDTQVVFISIDPERDTPAAMKTYISSRVFPKNITGLTGTPAQVAQAAKAYKVYYQKEGTGASYTMDHSTVLYLMDPSGRFVRPISEGTPEQDAQQISDAMRGA
jgi:protein SCO1/2